jgi:hypothetical protein
MPSHKTLKSIVRSIAESFTSLMNYYRDDYVLGHIVRAAWRTGSTEFQVDLLSGNISSSKLLVKPVVESVKQYIKDFPELVKRSQSSLEFISSAELLITVDPERKRTNPLSLCLESPYTCTASITDDRGKLYSHTVKGWWYPE